MDTAKRRANSKRRSWRTRFWAVVKYEMLWNIRKKKFIGIVIAAFALVTVQIALPAFFEVGENPEFAATFSVGNLVFFRDEDLFRIWLPFRVSWIPISEGKE